MNPAIHSCLDRAVDAVLDRDLIALLSTCFTGPNDGVFKTRRFCHEPPLRRWFIRDDGGGLIAHVAIHDKTLGHDGGEVRVAAVAEVCTHPAARGRGLVRLLLQRLHDDSATAGFGWAALFGKPEVYASSGYVAPGNPLRRREAATGVWLVKTEPCFQVRRLRDDAPPWPGGEIDLRGPCF